MYDATQRPMTGCMRGLYREFASFYEAERCPWAPENPKRAFNLAFKVIYPNVYDQFTEEEFLQLMYDTLGFPGSTPEGLFQTFDPKQYGGALPIETHFLNLFKQQLQWT